MRRLYFCEVIAWRGWEREGFYVDAVDQREAEEKAQFWVQFHGALGRIYPEGEAAHEDQLVQLALF